MTPSNQVLFLFSLFLLHEVVHPQLVPSGVRQFFESLFDGNLTRIFQDFRFIEASPDDVHFILFQPDNTTKIITSQEAATSLNPDNPTVMIIHGWDSSPNTSWVSEMTSLYNKKGGYNVMALDWSKDASLIYLQAASASQSIGNITGDFLLSIAKTNPNFLKKLHLIGHCLGGHIAGFAGKGVARSGQKIDRITGLDVAAPLFEIPIMRPSYLRLSSQDASFVDLVHTNNYFYGVGEAYGTVDFYVNGGGPIQPGCGNIDLIKANNCSHERSHEIYAKTILEPEKYEAVACISALIFNLGFCNLNPRAYLGEGVNRQARGTYYVNIKP